MQIRDLQYLEIAPIVRILYLLTLSLGLQPQSKELLIRI